MVHPGRGGEVLGAAERVVEKGYHMAGGAAIPLRRLGFGVSMVMDPRGSTLLDVLGDDLDERAHTMDRFLNRCSDEELTELLNAFQEAAARRPARSTTNEH